MGADQSENQATKIDDRQTVIREQHGWDWIVASNMKKRWSS